ncbi:MAG TPA: hypothetical protein VN541_21085, partial [Tepidisphaeraceae bacterium]|nr:hypothetical protein [Tepidisphaeraceae bacterium]
VPWGRSFDEYRLMFALGAAEMSQSILGCGDGPAAFNAHLTAGGGRVVSSDPIYVFDGWQIRERFEACVDSIMSQVKARPENYVWTYHADADALLRTRRAALENFLSDYATGRRQGRYLPAALPNLPFANGAFQLALCSHCLFLYSDLLSLDFHLASIEELCRVSREVRIFPLTDLSCEQSAHVGPVAAHLRSRGYVVEIAPVAYQLQKNGDRMMRIASRI